MQIIIIIQFKIIQFKISGVDNLRKLIIFWSYVFVSLVKIETI